MTVEQIMQAIGCTEEQARGVAEHFQATAKVEQGTVTVTARTIAFCPTCGKRQWHDGDMCIVCEGR